MILVMCICVFILCFRLENKFTRIYPLIKLIGENTLGIYLIHAILGCTLNKFIYY